MRWNDHKKKHTFWTMGSLQEVEIWWKHWRVFCGGWNHCEMSALRPDPTYGVDWDGRQGLSCCLNLFCVPSPVAIPSLNANKHISTQKDNYLGDSIYIQGNSQLPRTKSLQRLQVCQRDLMMSPEMRAPNRSLRQSSWVRRCLNPPKKSVFILCITWII